MIRNTRAQVTQPPCQTVILFIIGGTGQVSYRHSVVETPEPPMHIRQAKLSISSGMSHGRERRRAVVELGFGK